MFNQDSILATMLVMNVFRPEKKLLSNLLLGSTRRGLYSGGVKAREQTQLSCSLETKDGH